MKPKVAAFSLIIVLLFSALTTLIWLNPVNTASGQALSPDWSMFGYNAAHMGSPDDTAPAAYDVLWKVDLGVACDWIISSSPAVVNGVVYVGCDDGSFYALDASSGSALWSQKLGELTVSSPAVVGGVVYVSVWEGRDYALNASTGSVIWNYTRYHGASSPVVVNGLHYICSGNSSVVARNASTGVPVWSCAINGGAQGSPVVADNTVYVGSSGYVYAIDASTGTLRWSASLYISGTYNAVAAANGMVYVGCGGNVFYALDAATGKEVWNATTGSSDCSVPTVAYGKVYVASYSGAKALNAFTGATVWSSSVSMWCSSMAAAGEVIYACNSEGIHALNADTGAQIWSYTPSNVNINSCPAVVGGVLYVKSGDGYLYAFGKTSYPCIALSSLVGLAGAHFTVTGAGYTSGSAATVNLNGQQIGSATVDALGHLSVAVSIPASTVPGTYTVTATDGAGKSASASFTIKAPAERSWPMYMHDLERSGCADGVGLVNSSLLWVSTVDRAGGFTMTEFASTPAVVGGIVYDANMNCYLYAIDAYTGQRYWRFNLGGIGVLSSPVVVDGVVYTGCESGVVAVDAYTGVEIWHNSEPRIVDSAPTVANGMVYVGTFDEYVYALRASDGQYVWRYLTGDYVLSSPAVVGNTVYVGSNDGFLYALNAQTGERQWRFNCEAEACSPAIVNGVIYVASEDGDVFALTMNGEKIWNQTVANRVSSFSAPSVYNGIVYVPTEGGVYALNAQTGQEIWHFAADYYLSSPVAAGVVYVANVNGTLYALDALNGTERWSFDLGSPIRAAPSLANGVLYIGTEAGSLYAIGNPQPAPPPTATPTPTPPSAPTSSSQTASQNGGSSTQNTSPTISPTVTPQQTTTDPTQHPPQTEHPTGSPDQETAAPPPTALIILGILGGSAAVFGGIGYIRYSKRRIYEAKRGKEQ